MAHYAGEGSQPRSLEVTDGDKAYYLTRKDSECQCGEINVLSKYPADSA